VAGLWFSPVASINKTEILLKVVLDTITITQFNYVCGVIISVLTSKVIDHGFDPWSGQTKDYQIGIGCFFVKH
jgi:hypothetical protein